MELMKKFVDLIFLQRHVIDALAVALLKYRVFTPDELKGIEKAAKEFEGIQKEVDGWTQAH